MLPQERAPAPRLIRWRLRDCARVFRMEHPCRLRSHPQARRRGISECRTRCDEDEQGSGQPAHAARHRLSPDSRGGPSHKFGPGVSTVANFLQPCADLATLQLSHPPPDTVPVRRLGTVVHQTAVSGLTPPWHGDDARQTHADRRPQRDQDPRISRRNDPVRRRDARRSRPRGARRAKCRHRLEHPRRGIHQGRCEDHREP